ncbi:MAG: hypothetical protein ACKO2P_02965 [Planctomycetota bacterium]
MERHRSRVVGSAGTVPGGLAGWIPAALPRLWNHGYRCNIANHHKRKKRPNHRSQICRSAVLLPEGLSPQRGAPVSSRRLHDRQNVSTRRLRGLSPAGRELGKRKAKVHGTETRGTETRFSLRNAACAGVARFLTGAARGLCFAWVL